MSLTINQTKDKMPLTRHNGKKTSNIHPLAQLFKANLRNPSETEQENVLALIRKLSMKEIQEFYQFLIKESLITEPLIEDTYITGDSYEAMRIQRRKDYIDAIKKVAEKHIKKLPHNGNFCDIGCGNAIVTTTVLKNFITNKGTVYCCDIINYIDEKTSQIVKFTQLDGLLYMKTFSDNYFDGIMETATLHHLKSKHIYKKHIKEMARVVKQNGSIILLETTHTSWSELLRNAVLDIVSNDTTSRLLTGKEVRKIPVPIQFLSHEEILKELQKNNITNVESYSLVPNIAAPQLHRVYVGIKN